MSLGVRTLDVFLVQAFGLVTFGSLGSMQGSRGVWGSWAQSWPVKGCVGSGLSVAKGSCSSGKISTTTY